MTDEFNLVPGTNEEKLLDNILRAANGEDPQYDLAPNWRVEQYLAAIASALASGGGGGAEDFVVTFSGTTSEENAAVDKTLQEINEAFLAGKTIKLRYVTSDGDGSVIFELQKLYYANNGSITTLIGAFSDYNRYAIHCVMDDHGNLQVEYQEL